MARVILSDGETYNTANDDTQILGAGGDEQVVILNGVTGASVDSNVEQVDFAGAIADFQFTSTGGQLNVFDADGNLVAEISDAGGKQVVFSDGALDVAVDGTGLTVGGEDIPGVDVNDPTAPVVPAAITPAPAEIDGTTTSDAPTFGDGDTGGGTTPPASGTDLTADQDDFDGTTGDDTFDAPLSPAGTQTLQTFDRIDGLDGTDTLNVTLPGAVSAVTNFAPANNLSTAVKNVENFYLQSLSAQIVDFTGVDTVEQVWSDRSQANLTTASIENKVTLGVVEGEGTTVTNSYVNGLVDDNLDGGRFTQDVVLEDADVTFAVNEAVANFGGAVTTATVNFDLTGDNTIIMSGQIQNVLDTVTTSGDGSLDLDLTTLPTVDLTATFGGGDDTLRLDAGDLDGDDDIDMGAGTGDVLALSNPGGSTANEFDEAEIGFDLSGVSNAEGLILIDNVELVAAGTLDIVDFDNVTFEDDVDGSGADLLTVETSAADLDLTFEVDSGATGFGLEVSDEVTSLTLTAGTEAAAADLTVGQLFNAADGNGDTESLQTLTLVNANADDADGSTQTITLGDGGTTELDGLTMIDLSGAGQDDDAVVLDATDAGFDAPVTVMIGETDVDYENDTTGNLQEIFQFVGDDIGTIQFGPGNNDTFEVSSAGGGDRIDFSMFDAVSGTADLATNLDGTNLEITAAAGQFDGTITIVGAYDASDLQTLNDDSFIF